MNIGGTSGKTTISTGVIAGIAAGCIVLVIGLVCVGIYALLQKKKANRASIQSTPFGMFPCTRYVILQETVKEFEFFFLVVNKMMVCTTTRNPTLMISGLCSYMGIRWQR